MLAIEEPLLAAHHTGLRVEAAKLKSLSVVSLRAFKAVACYTAVCPECRTSTTVHGYATTRPPMCGCGTRMMKA